MTISFVLSENLRDEVIEHYRETSVENNPPYSIFQSKDCGTVVTLYQSGKMLIQGISADIDYNLWRDREKFLNNRDLDKELAKVEQEKQNKLDTVKNSIYRKVNTMGSDEVGTGDYFGPIVVAATYVSVENIPFLDGLGVKDSKKLTDKNILEIAPKLIAKIPYSAYILSPYEFNTSNVTNMNQIKSILHNKVLVTLNKKENLDYRYIVIDQFTPGYNYFKHIKNVPEKLTKIEFITKAEDQCYAVGAASIISRYLFLKEMDKISAKYNIVIPKGAGDKVDLVGKDFVLKYGKDELKNVAKLSFKNTEKIEELLSNK